jgi:enamine deaminase RidA (YjgF/YER057c/UK114 family)
MTYLQSLAVANSATLRSSPNTAQIIRVARANAPFATTVRADPDAEMVFVSGVVPVTLDGDALEAGGNCWGTTEEQARLVFRKLTKVLAEKLIPRVSSRCARTGRSLARRAHGL